MPGITLILLNWKRVDSVIYNVKCYSLYNLIDEIIVFNNNADVDLKHLSDAKVTIIESSKDLGLYTRFAAAGLAKNECIMHSDDDLFVPEKTVNSLYKEWLRRPGVCHGIEGRVIASNYNFSNVIGNVHVVLTRCVLVSKRNCLSAFTFSVNFHDLRGVPFGNGEDIILSYVSMYNGKQLNRTYKLPYSNNSAPDESDDTGPIAIHKRWEHHIAHRTLMAQRCRQLLFKTG